MQGKKSDICTTTTVIPFKFRHFSQCSPSPSRIFSDARALGHIFLLAENVK